MAGVTQTIDTYFAGMSQQPDLKKFPGQVKNIVNGIPDLTEGLYKRPGSKRIGSDQISSNKYGITGIPSGGSWFHYYRDETEGSYIGQVDENGFVRIWSCLDGTEKNVHHVTDNNFFSASDPADTAISSLTDLSPISKYQDPSEDHYAYLKTKGVGTSESIQALTINDTTFLVNRDREIKTTGTTPAREHSHFAFIDLLRSENGRQYAVNIYSNETPQTIKRATRVKIKSDTLIETGGSAHCPGIGTQVFSATGASSYSGTNIVSIKNSSGTDLTSDRENLIFRITALGQQGQVGSWDHEGVSIHTAFACTYNRQIVLLHGGEGWEVGDEITVTLDQAQDPFNYTVVVEEIEEVQVKANIKAVRPTPTPFDADTAVTVDAIIGGITAELSGTSINHAVIGSGIYLYTTDGTAFSVEVTDKDLMRVMQDQVNDVSELPIQCRDGYILTVKNAEASDEDDYYLKFNGNDGLDGPGAWEECAKPGIVKSLNAKTMPHVLERQADGDFLIKQHSWADRLVGDDTTNALPSFADGESKINKVVFFRNRITFLSGSNVILGQPGELSTPNFFAKTALAVSAIDPIDISCASVFPAELFDAAEVPSGLVVFSTNQQFLLSTDAEVMNPDTANLRSISAYNYNKNVPPISMGTTIGYIDNSGKYSRFNEMANVQREGEPTVIETSKLVPSLLPKDIDLLTNSRENSLVLFSNTDSDLVYGYKFFNAAEKREQAAWFKIKLNNPIKYHFIIDDEYFFLDTDNFLQKISLMQQDSDPNIEENSVNYLINLDNWTTITNGVYDPNTKLTTFTNQSDWIDVVTSPNGALVLVDTDTDSTRIGRYAECTVINGDDFTVPGDWSKEVSTITVTNGGSGYSSAPTVTITNHGSDSTGTGATATATIDGGVVTAVTINNNGYNYTHTPTVAFSGGGGSSAAATATIHTGTFYIGYLYDYQVEFPKFYLTQSQGNKSRSDINSSLTLHRLKFNFGKSGLYTTTLKRVGKADYVETYESTFADNYLVSDAPYVPDQVKTVPVYENTNNVDIHLSSSHPAPATLHALSWEGDYIPRNYRRV